MWYRLKGRLMRVSLALSSRKNMMVMGISLLLNQPVRFAKCWVTVSDLPHSHGR